MASEGRGTGATTERVIAVERLDAALDEQTRRRHHREVVQGTSSELEASAAMCAADEQAAARGAWLKWVDEREH